MSPIQIGITTCEVGEVVAFEFHLPIPGAEGPDAKFPSLRADFIDGTAITTRGNEAVTLKVLLASLGIREVNACHTKEAYAPDRAVSVRTSTMTVPAPNSSASPSAAMTGAVLHA